MQDIVDGVGQWLKQDKDFVMATVIRTWGSGPRKVGSGMAIGWDDTILGSVSGGCVEGDVVKQSEEVKQTGKSKLLHYGITDDEAWEVGLSCGGQIDILLESVNKDNRKTWKELSDQITNNKGVVLASSLDQPSQLLLDPKIKESPSEVFPLAVDAYRKRKSQVIETEKESYFLNVFPKKSQLFIVGAAHISSQLVELATLYDFETHVIDPRGLFTDKTDFKTLPDHTFPKWPAEVLTDFDLGSDSYAVMLTHDPKIDDQALHILLRSEVAYIGALGSKKTHAKRVARLTEEGFSEEEISRIHAPIGVSINAKNPREIALSIIAELIMTRNQYL